MHRHKGAAYIGVLATILLVSFAGGGIRQAQAISEPTLREPQAAPNEPAFAPGRIIVKVKEQAPADAIESLNTEAGARIEETIPDTRVSVVALPANLSVDEAVKRYEASPDVAYAEPDFLLEIQDVRTPNDRNYHKLYGLSNTGQYGSTIDSDIDAPEAWNVTTGSAATVVAVIDTGMDVNHVDLKENIWTNPDEIPGNHKDDDKNGYKDDVHGWDFFHDDASVYDRADDNSHGTHVAGTIAATGNNGRGVTGVNWQAKLMPLKIFSSEGETYISDAVEATNYAVAQGAKISNNSWAGSNFSQTLLDAIKDADSAGHLYVAGAGNGGSDKVGDNNAKTPVYPASYDSSNIISVAASDHHDNLASFSNYGATSVDLAAPGVEIYSTLPNDTYGLGSGTSMATPHVSGAAALILSKFPDLTDEEVKTRILRSVDTRRNLKDKLISGGRVNAARALGVDLPPPPSTAPEISIQSPAKTRDRTPKIIAKVKDAETNLHKDNITKVRFDGRQISDFSYSKSTDKLRFKPTRKLSSGRHKIKVTAEDPQGLRKTKTWRIRVIR